MDETVGAFVGAFVGDGVGGNDGASEFFGTIPQTLLLLTFTRSDFKTLYFKRTHAFVLLFQ